MMTSQGSVRLVGKVIATVVLIGISACKPPNTDVFLEAPYRVAIEGNPVLREAGGGMIVNRVARPPLLIGVGFAGIPEGRSLDACAEQVNEARFEAIVAASAANAPLHVMYESTLEKDKTVSVVDADARREVIKKLTRTVHSEFEEWVRHLRPVGRWRGKVGDQEVVFIAVGAEISSDTFREPSH
jgi:hypothetical protein